MRLCFLLLIAGILLTAPLSASENKKSHESHIAALELSIMGQTRNFKDPYSLPAGIGILYEFHGFQEIPVFIGAEAEWFGFVPLLDSYGDSSMVVPSIILGYNSIKELGDNASISFSPFVSPGIYFRNFEKNLTIYKGSKPVIKTGIDIMLKTEKKYIFSIGIFYMVILDNKTVYLPGYKNRIGYAF